MRIDWYKHEIDVSKASGNKTFCPKCHGSRKDKSDKSLSFDKQTGLFNCHYPQCDFKGCAMVKDNDLLATEKMAKVYSMPIPKLQHVGDKMLNWFIGRGIDNNTLLKFRVTESQEWMPGCQNGNKVTAICFNYYRGETLVNIKYRSADKKFRMEKNAELILYNLNALALGKEIVIVEGEMDALSLWQSGVCNVVSVPNGASKSNNAKLEYLDNCWADIEHIEKIIIAVDDDEAGKSLKAELVRRLGPERCWQVVYLEGCKDANEVLVKHGPDAVKKMIAEATLFPLEGVATVYDEFEGVIDIYKHGHPKGPVLGWSVDEYVRFRPGLFTIITGTPGSGKSTWLNNVLIRLASLHQWSVAMFTPEKTPIKYLISELASIHNGMPIHRTDPALKMSQEQLLNTGDFLDAFFYFLRVGEVDMSLDGLLSKAVECVKRYGIKAFVIDPWNYLEHQREKHLTETEHISISLTKITTFCKKYDVHVFLIAHPAKPPADPGQKGPKPGSLYSISGSANFYNKADIGITVFRNRKDTCTDIYVQKIRWWWDGKEGCARQFFELKSQRFLDEVPVEPWTPYRSEKVEWEEEDEES